MCVCVLCLLSHVRLFVAPWTRAHLCSWNSPGKNPEVGCHFLLQGIFPTQGLNPHLLCLLHWQVDSLPLSHLGSPLYRKVCNNYTWVYPKIDLDFSPTLGTDLFRSFFLSALQWEVGVCIIYIYTHTHTHTHTHIFKGKT